MPAFKCAIQELTVEEAYEIASELEDGGRTDHESSTVFRGVHPKYGPVYITIPIAGDALLLPTEFLPKPVLLQGDFAKVA
jgi:hypothetical protein